jgi:hypothetical protein
MDLHSLDLYWVHKKGAKYWPGCVGLRYGWKVLGEGGNEPKDWGFRAAWNRQGFGAPMSNTRLTVVALLSRPSYLPSPPTNGRTQGRTCPPTRRKRAFDRRRKGVWRLRQNIWKKGFVTVADIDAAVRRSTQGACVRPSVCVFCAGQ